MKRRRTILDYWQEKPHSAKHCRIMKRNVKAFDKLFHYGKQRISKRTFVSITKRQREYQVRAWKRLAHRFPKRKAAKILALLMQSNQVLSDMCWFPRPSEIAAANCSLHGHPDPRD